MMTRFAKTAVAVVLLSICRLTLAQAPATAESADVEAKYSADISKRADKIVASLNVTDAAASTRVHDLIRDHYREMRAVHDPRDAALKEAKGDEAKTQAIKDDSLAKLKVLHDKFLADLAKDLTPEQVDLVKDGLVYGKVEFTYRGYLNVHPNMTDEEKAKVKDFLLQARELAMDGGSSKEKDLIFEKFKGKINNYLSKNEKARQAATQPATQPAK